MDSLKQNPLEGFDDPRLESLSRALGEDHAAFFRRADEAFDAEVEAEAVRSWKQRELL
ncbi:hypothetical protein [Streptomyces sp. NPDC007083]|uniref:hypothetical protein n=1 Tax=Streptomyces sp. NPDC007083 TaxID=3156913 RepID=UPI00340BB991